MRNAPSCSPCRCLQHLQHHHHHRQLRRLLLFLQELVPQWPFPLQAWQQVPCQAQPALHPGLLPLWQHHPCPSSFSSCLCHHLPVIQHQLPAELDQGRLKRLQQLHQRLLCQLQGQLTEQQGRPAQQAVHRCLLCLQLLCPSSSCPSA